MGVCFSHVYIAQSEAGEQPVTERGLPQCQSSKRVCGQASASLRWQVATPAHAAANDLPLSAANSAAITHPSCRPSNDSCRPTAPSSRPRRLTVCSSAVLAPRRFSADTCATDDDDGCCSPVDKPSYSPVEKPCCTPASDCSSLCAVAEISKGEAIGPEGAPATQWRSLTGGEGGVCGACQPKPGQCVADDEDAAAALKEVKLGHVIGHCARSIVYDGMWRNQRVAVTITNHILHDNMEAAYLEHVVKCVMSSPCLQHPSLIRVHLCVIQRPSAEDPAPLDLVSSRDVSTSSLGPAGELSCLTTDANWLQHCRGACVSSREVWTVTERSDTPSLELALRLGRLQKHAFNLSSILRTAYEVASGLHHMHSHGLVHGYLNSANVLLYGAPNDPRTFTAKISSASHLATQAFLCDRGCAIMPRGGALAQTAPEVVLSGEPLSPASDIYSLGVLLWEMLGMHPAASLKPAKLMRDMIEHRTVLPPLENCPPAIQALVASCTHPAAAMRPALPEVLASLEALLKDISTPNPGHA